MHTRLSQRRKHDEGWPAFSNPNRGGTAHELAAAFVADHHGVMTPMHILALKPHADSGSILACLDLNMDIVFSRDKQNMNPMDYLWKYEKIDTLILVIRNLCIHREVHSDNTLPYPRAVNLHHFGDFLSKMKIDMHCHIIFESSFSTVQ